jgi:enamine deaminase RidA (YjgF/YER057c/UK114 family)
MIPWRFFLFWSILMFATSQTYASDIVCFAPDDRSGSAGAVRVDAVSLIHTEQALPIDAHGSLSGGTVAEQFRVVLSRLDAAGQHAGAGLDRCVKLNVYLRNNADAEVVRIILAEKFKTAQKPAVCYVTSKLVLADALVAADAVIATACQPRSSVERFSAQGPHGAYTVLSPGGRAYISGQAEPGDIATATRKTLESLRKALEFMDLNLTNVVQLKSFLTPITDVEIVKHEIRSFFGKQPTPPLVFVEWISAETTPIEIELIAAVPPEALPATAPSVEYLTPPGMTAPPIYSRITRINSSTTIYVSGLYGSDNDAEKQVRDVFNQLTELLEPAGADLRHLVKATYYVSDEHVSAQLNAQRPKYYDPQRPPAASKAMVSGVAINGRSLTLDMIAVPSTK